MLFPEVLILLTLRDSSCSLLRVICEKTSDEVDGYRERLTSIVDTQPIKILMAKVEEKWVDYGEKSVFHRSRITLRSGR